MYRTILLTVVYFGYVVAGFVAPFVATLGYVWVDTFRPQYVVYYVLNQIPVAMVMGMVAAVSYLAFDRRSLPKLGAMTALNIGLAVWCSITMLWAVGDSTAWEKWDWATKTMLFAAFLPFVIRSRVQIEAFVQTYLLALAANFISFGAKTLISGGGYGKNLGLMSGNGGFAEGGLLSTACLMAVPLALYLAQHNRLLPKWKTVTLAYWGLAGLALITATGTYQRSALIGLAALGLIIIFNSRHKLLFSVLGGLIVVGLAIWKSDEWLNRMSSITNYEADTASAVLRIRVWQWTLEFVKSYPLGGGFQAYVINSFYLPSADGNPEGVLQHGRAFHSIYFEMLGEQGWPGLAMFLTLIFLLIRNTFAIARIAKVHPELEWCGDLARAIRAALAAFLTAGAFVGIAFQPMFWYVVALSICLQSYVHRVTTAETSRIPAWRSEAQRQLNAASAPLRPGGWRRPTVPVSPRSGAR